MLAEIVLAFRDHWINKRLPANVAGKGQRFFIIIVILLPCFVITTIPTHSDAALAGLLRLLPLLLYLPSRLVVPSVMHELAGIAIATVPCLLVVLANVRLVVEPSGEPDVRRRAERPVRPAGLLRRHRVLPAEPGLVIRVAVDPLVHLPGARAGAGGRSGGVLLQGLLGLLKLPLADGARVAVELRLRLERGGGAAVGGGLDRPRRLVLEPAGLRRAVRGGEEELAGGRRRLLGARGGDGAGPVFVVVVGARGRGRALPDVLRRLPHEAADRRRATGPGLPAAAAAGHRGAQVLRAPPSRGRVGMPPKRRRG